MLVWHYQRMFRIHKILKWRSLYSFSNFPLFIHSFRMYTETDCTLPSCKNGIDKEYSYAQSSFQIEMIEHFKESKSIRLD